VMEAVRPISKTSPSTCRSDTAAAAVGHDGDHAQTLYVVDHRWSAAVPSSGTRTSNMT
jgi:hypothetical protein